MGQFRYLAEAALCLAFDQLQVLRSRHQMRQGLHKKMLSETVCGAPASTAGRYAVIAVYPSPESIPFTLNLLNALTSNGFWVLVVSTRPVDETNFSLLRRACHHLIERPNVGMDFGSYKLGIEWLEQNYSVYTAAETLVIANDSMFYPQRVTDDIAEMLDRPAAWQSLFENFQFHYHAQSFFLLFRSEVIQSEPFRRFWTEYLPYSSRLHAIHKGEVRLSKRLRKIGMTCEALYSLSRFASALEHCEFDLWQVAELSPGDEFRSVSRSTILRMLRLQHTYDLHAALMAWRSTIAHYFETTNPTHVAALFCNHLFGAPLKRDICSRGPFDIYQVIRMAQGFDEAEKAAMSRDLRLRGRSVSRKGIQRVLWDRGRI